MKTYLVILAHDGIYRYCGYADAPIPRAFKPRKGDSRHVVTADSERNAIRAAVDRFAKSVLTP